MKSGSSKNYYSFSKSHFLFTISVILLTLFLVIDLNGQTGFVVDHNCTNLDNIPDSWIDQAKADLHITYNHTSHGSQLPTGMDALMDYPDFGSKYNWVNDSQGDSQNLSMNDSGIPGAPNDLSQGDHDYDGNGIDDWADDTYDFLINPDNYYINVVLWSWCNIAGHNIPRYLDSMDWLIGLFSEGGTHERAADHPVKFVFITAHANGGGEGDSSDAPNEEIRAHVAADPNAILFDFSDIENYNPDDNYFLDKLLQDDLDYDSDNNGSQDANWAVEYLADYDDGELDRLTTGDNVTGYNGCGSCAHSNTGPNNEARLNCVLKGRASWYLFARLAGWDGTSSGMPLTWTSSAKALIQNNNALIEWSVSNQSNNEKFIIEHSSNGKLFYPIGTINIDYNQKNEVNYSFTHKNPLEGHNYYRIKQIDFDGNYSYSNIAFVKYNPGNTLYIYPNPTKGKVMIYSNKKEKLEIYNFLGKSLMQISVDKGKTPIDLSGLKQGIYYFINNENKIKKIVLN